MFVGRLGILLLLSALWQALYKSRIERQKRIGYPKADLYVQPLLKFIMADWWQWSPKKEEEALTFAVVGVGRFGTAVCRELISLSLIHI